MALVQRKITEMFQTLRLAKKTSREDYSQHLRLVVLGMLAVGGRAVGSRRSGDRSADSKVSASSK